MLYNQISFGGASGSAVGRASGGAGSAGGASGGANFSLASFFTKSFPTFQFWVNSDLKLNSEHTSLYLSLDRKVKSLSSSILEILII